MTIHSPIARVAFAGVLTATVGAQQPPIRPLGRIEQVSSHVLSSVSTAVLVPGGLLVNDFIAHRVLLFDSTLTRAVVIIDSTNATRKLYGVYDGSLLPYRGDSAVFIDPASRSMLVISPRGVVVRATPTARPDEIIAFTGGPFGIPGLDARGRLVYFSAAGSLGVPTLGEGQVLESPALAALAARAHAPDSAFVLRVDPATGVLDTAASFKIENAAASFIADAQDVIQSIQITRNPLPVVDEWAVCSDGTLAIVRGRDVHIDWVAADGIWRSAPKIPFDRQHLDKNQKTAIIDSAVKAEQVREDLGRARSMGAGPGGRRRVPYVFARSALSDVPDDVPAFKHGAVRADADGNLWIRTTTMAKSDVVYDIVTCRGELVDRVQIPSSRTIAGFAPGVVYLAARDNDRFTHLERVRVR
jgi:hypothetical protein